MKITNKLTNKLVSYVDRYFTYDDRKMKREDANVDDDFFGWRMSEGERVVVAIDRPCKNELFVYIRRNGVCVHSRFVRSFDDINNFKKMVRCLG